MPSSIEATISKYEHFEHYKKHKYNFFTTVKNRFSNFVNSAKGQDKILQAAVQGAYPIAFEITKAAGASDHVLGQFEVGKKLLKGARDITAFFNIFRGVIAGIYLKIKTIAALILGLGAGTREVVVGKKGTYNEVAHGRTEQLLKLGEHAGGLVAAVGYVTGFGIARPAANIRKYFDVGYGAVGNTIADSFPYLMCMTHCGGIVQNTCGLAYEFAAYNRVLESESYAKDLTLLAYEFYENVVTYMLDLVQTVLELFNDAIVLLRLSAPVWVRLSIAVVSCSIGFVNVWRKTV